MTFKDAMSTISSYVQPSIPGANPAPVTRDVDAATYAVGGGASLVAIFLGYKVLRYFGIIPKVF